MSKTISAETARIKIELIKGATYTLPFTLTGYGDCTGFTWVSSLRNAGDNSEVNAPTVTALSASSVSATISATQATELSVNNNYEWVISFTDGATKKVPLFADVSVIEGT